MSYYPNLKEEYKELFIRQIFCRQCQVAFDIVGDINVEIGNHIASKSHGKQFELIPFNQQQQSSVLKPTDQQEGFIVSSSTNNNSVDNFFNINGSRQYLFEQIQRLKSFRNLKSEVQRSYLIILKKFMKFLLQQNKEQFTKNDALEFIQQSDNEKRAATISFLMKNFKSDLKPSQERGQQEEIPKDMIQPTIQQQIESYTIYFEQFLRLLRDHEEILIFIISFLVFHLHCDIKQILQLKFAQLKSADLFDKLKVPPLNFDGKSIQSYVEQFQQSLNLNDDDYLLREQKRKILYRKVKQIIKKYSSQASDINFKKFIENITLNQVKNNGQYIWKKSNREEVKKRKNQNVNESFTEYQKQQIQDKQHLSDLEQSMKNQTQLLKFNETQVQTKNVNLDNVNNHPKSENDLIDDLNSIGRRPLNEFVKRSAKTNQKIKYKFIFLMKNQQQV